MSYFIIFKAAPSVENDKRNIDCQSGQDGMYVALLGSHDPAVTDIAAAVVIATP